MKHRVLPLALFAFAIASCSKYGPEQDRVPETTSLSETAPAADEALKDDVAVFYNLPQHANYSLRCDLNSVSGVGLSPRIQGPLAQAPDVIFNGWVVDAQGAPPSKVVIVLKGEKSFGILVATGAARPDVAEALSSEAAHLSGIAALADTSAVAAGTYQVHLLVPETDAACDTTKLLKVDG